MGDSFASILDAAGTNCFDVRLGAGDRKPKGVCPRTAGEPLTVACDAGVVGVLGRSGAGVALSLAVLNRLPDPTTAGATAVNLDFFRPPPPLALSTLFPNLDAGLAPAPPPSRSPPSLSLARFFPSTLAPISPDVRARAFPPVPRTFGANARSRRRGVVSVHGRPARAASVASVAFSVVASVVPSRTARASTSGTVRSIARASASVSRVAFGGIVANRRAIGRTPVHAGVAITRRRD